jgi:lysophospholipase L1-like esterase
MDMDSLGEARSTPIAGGEAAVRPSQRLFGNLLLVLGSFLAPLVLAELAFRVFYTCHPAFDLDHLERDFDDHAYSAQTTPPKNEKHFRQWPLPDGVFDESTTRVLVLGDSVTFGFGVQNGLDRFTDRIQQRANEELRPQHRHVHLYNAGVSGTNPDTWVHYLTDLAPEYKPQHVFAIFFLRDGTELCTSLACHKEQIGALQEAYDDKLWYRYSHLGNYLGNALIARDFEAEYADQIRKSYLGSPEERRPWRLQRQALREIKSYCDDHGIDMRLVIFPLLYGLESEKKYQFHDVEDEITRFASEAGIPSFSLLQGFLGHDGRSLWVAPNDQHPNAQGHAIAANTLYPYFMQAIQSGR